MLRRTTVTGTVAALLLWGLATPGLAAPDDSGRQLSGLRPTSPSGSSAKASAAADGARADFDGDGIDDLVSAYNSVTQWTNGSSMVVFYSSSQGQQNGENYFGIGAYTAQGVEFAAGDFDNDGYHDLVMGLPFTGPHDGDSFGSAYIWYGSANGLHIADGRMFYIDQNTGNIPGTSENGDEFARALAAGDLNSDGYDDLAIGSPGEAIGTTSRAGMIHAFLGGPDGIQATAVGLSQADAQVPGESEAGDEFGMSVAIGDVTGDGYADVAVGSPGENGYGMVTLLKGTASGINPRGATAQVAPTTAAVTPHRLGQTITLADLTRDDRAEVITGAPDSTVIGHTTAGAVSIHLGTLDGLTSDFQAYWHQDSPDVPGSAENGDRLGTTLTTGNLLADGRTDLVVGVQNEAVGTATRAGAIMVLPGAATLSGLTGTGSLFIDQNTTDVPDTAETGDRMGSGLQVVVDSGYTYLAVGAFEEQVAGGGGSGSITYFVNDNGTLRPLADTVTGPEVPDPGHDVYRLGMSLLES